MRSLQVSSGNTVETSLAENLPRGIDHLEAMPPSLRRGVANQLMRRLSRASVSQKGRPRFTLSWLWIS